MKNQTLVTLVVAFVSVGVPYDLMIFQHEFVYIQSKYAHLQL
jgi:hypothetical protein